MQALIFVSIVVTTYYLMSIIQALLHRSFGHRRIINAVFVGHAIGHHGKYPASRLRSKAFIKAEARAVDYYLIPAIIFAWSIYGLFGAQVALACVVGVAASFAWHIYLHRQYHLLDTPFERFEWFRIKRELHFEHHRNARVNFAVVEFWVDDLMGTRSDR